MWDDNRLHWLYPLHWSPAVPKNAQKLPHRYRSSEMSQPSKKDLCRWISWEFVIFKFQTPCLTNPPPSIPTGTSKKSAMVEEPDTARQNGTAKTEQTESQESSWEEQQKFWLVFISLWRKNLATINKDICQQHLNEHLFRLFSVKMA